MQTPLRTPLRGELRSQPRRPRELILFARRQICLEEEGQERRTVDGGRDALVEQRSGLAVEVGFAEEVGPESGDVVDRVDSFLRETASVVIQRPDEHMP